MRNTRDEAEIVNAGRGKNCTSCLQTQASCCSKGPLNLSFVFSSCLFALDIKECSDLREDYDPKFQLSKMLL